MTRSRSSARSKSQAFPPGPGRRSNAPADSTPKCGRRSAIAVTLGGENTPATMNLTSPGVAPAANNARAKSTAS
eukprot:10823057-Alexandrium_andersonii.AAC.1